MKRSTAVSLSILSAILLITATVVTAVDHLARGIIKGVAAAHDIPMVENVPLARGLYKHVKVGRPVPSKFYRAVAEVLRDHLAARTR